MTNTTRINHTGHNHPNTTAARTACRKAIRENTPTGGFRLASIGNGTRLHYIDYGTTTRCGKEKAVFIRYGTLNEVTCKGCESRYGLAHN